ncbi:MAG: RHS repeat-associated core domain-containing protein [Candidatus Riflebacteria bacterium]|nr:RHS repeat-associated core domain-containing protein [Candidatus Riflebacteria bacterium]
MILLSARRATKKDRPGSLWNSRPSLSSLLVFLAFALAALALTPRPAPTMPCRPETRVRGSLAVTHSCGPCCTASTPHRVWHLSLVLRRSAAGLGVFLSPDPIGFAGGMNRYGYVGGNPLRYTDPRGLWRLSFNLPYEGGPGFGFSFTNEGLFVGWTRLTADGIEFTGGVDIAPVLVNVSRNAPSVAAMGLPPLTPIGGPTLSGPPGAHSGGALVMRRPGFQPPMSGFFSNSGGPVKCVKPPTSPSSSSSPAPRFTPDQDAIIDLVRDAVRRRGALTQSEADMIRQWADQYGLRFRGPETHPARPFGRVPHIHVGPLDHIEVR